MDLSAVVNEADLLNFRVENEDGPDISIGNVNVALGVDGNTVGLDKNVRVRRLYLIDLLLASKTIHPLLLLFCGIAGCRWGGLAFKLAQPANARSVGRSRPDQLTRVNFGLSGFGLLLGGLRRVLFLVAECARHQ